MNKYLLEVEAIQYTGGNTNEIKEYLSESLGLLKKDSDFEKDGEWLGFSDGVCTYGVDKGDYIIVVPKKGTFGGFLLAVIEEKEFNEYARRLHQ